MKLQDIISPGTEFQVLGTGYGFTEGPAADGLGNVYFSDGQNDSIHFCEIGKPITLFVADSTDANGMMFNHKGELLVCEGAAHRIVAIDVQSRAKRILASQIYGTHFNEPNDLSVDEVDGFYFTDPNYGHRGQATVMKEDAYYCSPEGRVSRVSTVCVKPNGVILSPDGKVLYLADNRGERIYKYDVTAPGRLTNERGWIELGARPDGMTLDVHRNLYVGCGDAGVKVYSPSAEYIGAISVPYASNLVFGGTDFTTLFITSRDKLLSIRTRVEGIRPPGSGQRTRLTG